MMGSSFEWDKDYDPRDYAPADERAKSALSLEQRVLRLEEQHYDYSRLSDQVEEIRDELQITRSALNPLGGSMVLREMQVDLRRVLDLNEMRGYVLGMPDLQERVRKLEQSKEVGPGLLPKPTKIEHWEYRDGCWNQVPHLGKGKAEDNSGLIAVLVLLVTAGIAAIAGALLASWVPL